MKKRKRKTRLPGTDLSLIIESEEAYRRKTSGLRGPHTLRIPREQQHGKVKLYIAKRSKATRNVLDRILR